MVGARSTELTTPRCRLRPVTADDAEPLHELWSSPGVRRFLWDGEIIPMARTRAAIEQSQRMFEEQTFGLWGAWAPASRTLVGFGGLWHFRDPPDLELLYGVAERLWGQGYAGEIAQAVLTVLLRFAEHAGRSSQHGRRQQRVGSRAGEVGIQARAPQHGRRPGLPCSTRCGQAVADGAARTAETRDVSFNAKDTKHEEPERRTSNSADRAAIRAHPRCSSSGLDTGSTNFARSQRHERHPISKL